MAPPHKKRRLFSWLAGDEVETYADTQGVGQTPQLKQVYSHVLSEVGQGMEEHNIAHDKPLIPSKNEPREVDEVMLAHIGHGMDEHNVEHIHARQDNSAAVVTAVVNTFVTIDQAALSSAISTVAAATSDLPSVSLSVSSTPAPALSIPASSDLPTSLLPTNLTDIIPSTSILPGAGSSAITSLPITTSALSLSLTSSSKNVTVAENALTNGLQSSILLSIFPTGTIRSSSGYLNSSLTYSSPTLTSSATTSDGDNVATSYVLTTATVSSGGQPVSTITTAIGAAGFGGSEAPTDPSVSTTNAGSSPPPPPGTIAGGVVGGAAGLAVILLIAMLFLRWYRRRAAASHQELLPPAGGSYQDSPRPASGPGMAESAGMRPWAAAIPGLLRHQRPHQFSPPAGALVSQERGFQRISGKKLPSAWSPGMEAPPEMPPYRGSGYTSVYPESQHAVGNPFTDSSEEASVPSRAGSNERMTVVAGPQRRPTIHNPQRHLDVTGEAQSKHMSSVARTSGMGLSGFSDEAPSHS